MPIANNDSDKEARPLDPIYALSTHDITHGISKRKRSSRRLSTTKYNKWRESLPDHCFNCGMYDDCYPGRKCTHNPNCK